MVWSSDAQRSISNDQSLHSFQRQVGRDHPLFDKLHKIRPIID